MKINLDSPSARRLMQHGVKPRELKASRIFVFDFQIGDAITLPLPIIGPVILIKRRWLVFDDDDQLEDSANLKMLRHELCHVRQIQDWGGLAYMRRHIWARIKTRSILARTAIEESVCYSAQAKVTAFYHDRPDIEGQNGGQELEDRNRDNTQPASIPRTIIKLPVDVVLVENSEVNLARIMDIRRAMDRVGAFWAKMDIHVQPNIRAWNQPEDVLDYGSDQLTKLHYNMARARITIYIGSTLEVLPNTPGHVGKTSPLSGPYGSAIVAGAHGGIPEPDNLTAEIFNHELGHILSLDHDNSTFMRESVRNDGNAVSSAQREILRAEAYEWGSY